MMRAARTASLLLAFYLLTSAATADAECAWVLWTTPLKSDPPRWEPSAAFPTLEDCSRQYGRIFNEFNPKHPNAMVDMRCLPDTIDPRGPKGK
ncbi:MAG: hypothetical protein DMD93_12535 [Candidatus Rokuibacteriota bacterium]|nr:MAG: hypothetical protein DMD93_12535 [Candidatus Rokubacteria bacterium]